MKSASLFGIGACGGALAAFVLLVPDASRSVSSSTGTSSDAPLEAVARPRALPDSIEQRAGESQDAALASASEWAFIDPAGFFDHAEAADSIDGLIGGLEVLIATDPARVFEIAARFRGPARPEIEELYLHAVRGMAGRDPAGTIARLQAAATGAQRDPILANIAEAYAGIDADAALAWATSVVPPSADALGKVMESVATRDLLRAYEMLQRVPRSILNAPSLGTALVDAALRGRQAPAPLASALAVRGEPEAAGMLSRLMQQWTQREPGSAVAWMAQNEVYLSNDLTRAMVSGLAFEDVTLAAELAQRVPLSAQPQWLDAVANRYGQFDAAAGMSWLAEYEGRPEYDALLNSLLGGASRSSPQFVANYIASSDGYFDRNLVVQTASSFVGQDPDAAAQWAMELDDPEYSEWALEGVVGRWTQTDARAATRWVLNQSRGAARDRLLDTTMLSSVTNPNVDPAELLRAYSSDASAQRTLAEYIFRSTRVPGTMRDASLVRAESLLDRLTDPAFRQQAEAQIEAAR